MATDLERIDQLLADQEKTVRQAFVVFVRAVQSPEVMRQIIDRLENHDVEGAMVIVDSYISRMADVLPVIAATVGTATAAELADIIPDTVLAISFDPSHPRAAEIIRANRARFVTEMTSSQRRTVAQAIARGYQTGAGTAEIARNVRDAIGLSSEMEQHVANYRDKLVRGSREALDNVLRDRRFDRSVERAASGGAPLTEAQIERMTDRYRQRYLAYRSENIGRTEGVAATSLARQESADQMLEQTGIAEDRLERIWNTTKDKRRRDWHATMEGQVRRNTEPFTDGLGNRLRYPGDRSAPANTIINCRCIVTFRIKRA